MKIMAVDFGEARTGLAVCDKTEFLSSPIGTINSHNMNIVLQKTAIAAVEYGIGAIVVGLPVNMNGTKGERAARCEEFAEKLKSLVDVPVVMWDERSTTVTAHNILSENAVFGKKRKSIVDEVAASLILESFLAWRKNHPGQLPVQKENLDEQ